MADIFVSTQKELVSALKAASGGDRIVLADGDYGSLLLDPLYQKNVGSYDSPVTIVSATPGGAVFSSIEVRRASNLSFEGLTIETSFVAGYNASNIAVIDSTAQKMRFSQVDGVHVEGNHIEGGDWGLVLNRVQNFVVVDNTITRTTEDLIQITRDSSHGLIENNRLIDVIAEAPSHADMIQIQAIDGLAPSDITIRGNYIYDDPATGGIAAQGIFVSSSNGGVFRDLLIEQNLISVHHVNSLYINGGQDNVRILDNTLIAEEGSTLGGNIRLARASGNDNSGVTLEGNVFARLVDETGKSTIGDNVIYGSKAGEIFAGSGADLSDFVTENLSGYGAEGRLGELLGWGLEKAPPALTLPPPELPPAPELVYDLGRPLTLSGNLYLPAQWKGKLAEIPHVAHEAAMEIDQGTILIDFNADTLGWRRGLVSKDSAGTDNGFSAWLEDSKLHVKFEDDTSVATVVSQTLKARQDYALQVNFGDGQGQVWLDGVLVGEVDTDMDWSQNHAELTIGAENSQSALGSSAKMRYAYDGDFDAIRIYDQAMTPEELQHLLPGDLLA